MLAFGARRALVPAVPGPTERRIAPVLAERETCDVLFVGPSYVEDQVFPKEFDDEARRIGFDARACKYGAQALRGYELRHWLEQMLAHDWPRLKLVVIDVTLGEKIGFNPENWLNPRVVEWHTPASVPWLFRYYEARPDLPRGEKIATFLAHAKHVGANVLELGKGVEGLKSWQLAERLRPLASAQGDAVSGALDDDDETETDDDDEDDEEPKRKGSRRRWKGRVEGVNYARHVHKMIEKRSERGPNRTKDDWAVELRALVREHDKEAVFLIAPVLYAPKVPLRTRSRTDRVVVLDFNDPARYPELYRERVRGNTSHLRGEGGALYSRLLARELFALERGQR